VVVGWLLFRAEELIPQPDSQQWQRLSCGAGSKGERYYDWAKVPVNCDRSFGFQRWILFRRSLEHPEDPRISYYQVFAKSDTTLEMMARIAGQRWRIEECFKLARIPTRFRRISSSLLAWLASTYHSRLGGSNISYRITTPN